MTTAHHKASFIALLAGLTCALVLFGASWSALHDATPDRSPAEAVRHAPALHWHTRNADAESAPAKTYTTAYDRDMDVDWSTYAYGTGKAYDVAVVNETPGANLAATARACATGQKIKAAAVHCYVYGSREAFDALNQTASTAALSHSKPHTIPLVGQCWAVYGAKESGKAASIGDMRLAPKYREDQGCPKSWKGGK